MKNQIVQNRGAHVMPVIINNFNIIFWRAQMVCYDYFSWSIGALLFEYKVDWLRSSEKNHYDDIWNISLNFLTSLNISRTPKLARSSEWSTDSCKKQKDTIATILCWWVLCIYLFILLARLFWLAIYRIRSKIQVMCNNQVILM